MKVKFPNCPLLLLSALLAASCSGGGGGSASASLLSVGLSPPDLQLAPGGTEQLTVTGTYSNGAVQALPATGETFHSSNLNVATVSVGGFVTVAANALVGASMTITATDNASGNTTSAATAA